MSLDSAATIAVFASFLGYLSQRHEPFTWSEELIGPARAAAHPQLMALCAMAAQCVLAWRLVDRPRRVPRPLGPA